MKNRRGVGRSGAKRRAPLLPTPAIARDARRCRPEAGWATTLALDGRGLLIEGRGGRRGRVLRLCAPSQSSRRSGSAFVESTTRRFPSCSRRHPLRASHHRRLSVQQFLCVLCVLCVRKKPLSCRCRSPLPPRPVKRKSRTGARGARPRGVKPFVPPPVYGILHQPTINRPPP